MRFFSKALLGLALICASLVGVGCWWFYFYSGDIPNFDGLDNFTPAATTTAAYDCASSTIGVVPYILMGENVQRAVRVAEGEDRFLSRRISLRLFCNYKNQMQTLPRQVLELKASVQIQRRFTSEQILAIYINGAYFGDGIFGIEGASKHYYGKSPSELDIAQAAMLAGLLKAPSIYSLKHHPDRARARRNEVIAKMVNTGAITPAQGQSAIQSDSK